MAAQTVRDAVAADLPSGRALAFAGVGKRFPDGTEALTDVDLAIDHGEFVSVVGPSGCGKSTLLRIASGLDPATAGTVELGGRVQEQAQRRSGGSVGYVFQDATLLPWRTVQANVELLAELHRMPKPERQQKAAAAIELVGLDGFEKHRPRQLSGGMRMRVSLARSLTLSPSLFLFDEPFGALDEITRERMNDEVLRLFTLQRFGALFITHSVAEAVFLSTRVAVMSGRPGRILGEVDIPLEFPRTPQMRFTPEFAALAGQVSELLRGAHT